MNRGVTKYPVKGDKVISLRILLVSYVIGSAVLVPHQLRDMAHNKGDLLSEVRSE